MPVYCPVHVVAVLLAAGALPYRRAPADEAGRPRPIARDKSPDLFTDFRG